MLPGGERVTPHREELLKAMGVNHGVLCYLVFVLQALAATKTVLTYLT